MNDAEFVRAIHKFAVKSAVDDVETCLKRPPGRSPSPRLLAVSAWFNKLGEEDRRYLHEVIQMAARDSAFGFLCILDGVRRVVETENESPFELYFVGNEQRTRLNDPHGGMLHDLLEDD